MTKKEYRKYYYNLHKEEINKKRNKGIQNTRDLLPGEIFEKLKVVEFFGKDKNGKIAYLCICECGKTRVVRRSYLLSGRTKSCGCQKSLANSVIGKKYIHFAIESRRKFVGSLSGQMWSRILTNAKIRNIKLDITKEYAWELFLKQNKKCALTGQDLYLSPFHKERNKVTASLDRIDSDKGYTIENVQWIHKDINIMKNNLSEKKFKELCKLVIEYDSKTTK